MTSLQRIHNIYAETLFAHFNQKRFGLKSCSVKIEPEFADDLIVMYKRELEKVTCGYPCSSGCGVTKLEELINTL